MRTVTIHNPQDTGILEHFHAVLGGHLRCILKEKILEFNNAEGKGYIRGMRLYGGISFVEVNAVFNNPIQVLIKGKPKALLQFLYCTEGHLEQQFCNSERINRINPLQTTILCGIQSKDIVYSVGSKKPLGAIFIFSNLQDPQMDKLLLCKLKQTFLVQTNNDLFHNGSYNLKIADHVNQLDAISLSGVVRNLFIEGLVNIILSLEIQQHNKDQRSPKINTGSLTLKNLVEINELSKAIRLNPEKEYSVTLLSRKSGLTPAKLQEGFKFMHNRTVNEFIRDERTKKSEELILNTDLSISQIVYSIGFSSRSYFSKIFKERYKCTPYEYRSKNRTNRKMISSA